MNPLGPKYFELFDTVPLRPIKNAEEYVEANDFLEILKGQLDRDELSDDEIAYVEVLDLLLEEYEEFADPDTDDDIDEIGTEIAEETDGSDIDDIASEVESLLDEKKEALQEWDFVALCNSISTIVSRKMSELSE